MNCYKNCAYYFCFDDSHEHHCTESDDCPKNKSKLIMEKGECIVLKIEVKKKGMNKPRKEYEVYFPLDGKILSILDLNLCYDANVYVYL